MGRAQNRAVAAENHGQVGVDAGDVVLAGVVVGDDLGMLLNAAAGRR